MAYPILCFFLFALLFPNSFSSSFSKPFCNHHDYSALIQFKNSLSFSNYVSCPVYSRVCDDDSYPKTASWGNISNCCLWDGVTCDSISGHVIGLNLSYSLLQGQFHPNNSLFQLHHLQVLNLAHNYLHGSLVSSISHLSKLMSLDLSYNQMRLEPFTWDKLISNVTDLEELVLDGIDMTSIRPISLSSLLNLSSSLVFLSLSDTSLQGSISNVIICLRNLKHLDLSSNDYLKGQLPKSNWSSPLRYLDLSFTAFTGEVPDSISNLKSLNYFSLRLCQFEGHIPLGFGNLTQLTYLDLTSNKFSGEISFLSNLGNLIHLYLSENYFTGEILDVVGKFSKLKSLSLSNLNIGGPIPNQICKLSNLVQLDLSNNLLNGTIPSSCCSSSSLNTLVLNDNHLMGPICEFSSYTLKSCDLSNNKLQGNLPESIFDLTSLYFLGLSSNNLSGLVKFLQFSMLRNLEDLNLSNNKLLSISFNNKAVYTMTNLSTLDLSFCNVNSFPKLPMHLPNLRFLNLSNSNMHGIIPEWFNNAPDSSLQYLDLSHNMLTSAEHLLMGNLLFLDLNFNMLQGNLPIPVFGLEYFLVSNNKLSGDISSLFCNAKSLVMLSLSHNNLSGFIPECLVAFPHLGTLDLQMNNFVGTIPNQFAKTSSLQSLHFNNNQFEGRLPLSLVHCNHLEIFNIGANKIEDVFPNWLQGLPELQVLILRDNEFYGSISSSNAKHNFSKLKIIDVSNNHFSGPLPTTFIKNFKGMKQVV